MRVGISTSEEGRMYDHDTPTPLDSCKDRGRLGEAM